MKQATLDTLIRRTNKYAMFIFALSLISGILFFLTQSISPAPLKSTILSIFLVSIYLGIIIWGISALASLVYTIKYDKRHRSQVTLFFIIIIAAAIRYFFLNH